MFHSHAPLLLRSAPVFGIRPWYVNCKSKAMRANASDTLVEFGWPFGTS
jgi:hypothetical protein